MTELLVVCQGLCAGGILHAEATTPAPSSGRSSGIGDFYWRVGWTKDTRILF